MREAVATVCATIAMELRVAVSRDDRDGSELSNRSSDDARLQ